MININKKNLCDEYDDEDMKRNNIYFRKNPFINDVQENEERIIDKKRHQFWKFPGKGFLTDENFK